MLTIAIQNKGRLNEDTVALLADAGITASASHRKLISDAKGFPLHVLYLRDDDIPQAVAMGVADIGIVGLNEVLEKEQDVDILMKLGFGACRLSLAVPKATDYPGINWFEGKRVATSYPVILRNYFSENGNTAKKGLALTSSAMRYTADLKISVSSSMDTPSFPNLCRVWMG